MRDKRVNLISSNPNFEKSKEMAYPNWNRNSSWTLCTKSTQV